jgi:hypothetical protein
MSLPLAAHQWISRKINAETAVLTLDTSIWGRLHMMAQEVMHPTCVSNLRHRLLYVLIDVFDGVSGLPRDQLEVMDDLQFSVDCAWNHQSMNPCDTFTMHPPLPADIPTALHNAVARGFNRMDFRASRDIHVIVANMRLYDALSKERTWLTVSIP